MHEVQSSKLINSKECNNYFQSQDDNQILFIVSLCSSNTIFENVTSRKSMLNLKNVNCTINLFIITKIIPFHINNQILEILLNFIHSQFH